MLGSMAPAATGSIVEHLRKDGLTSYWLRFRAYGERHRIVLGTDEDGWTRNEPKPSSATSSRASTRESGAHRNSDPSQMSHRSPRAFTRSHLNGSTPACPSWPPRPKSTIAGDCPITSCRSFTPSASTRSTPISSINSDPSSSRRPMTAAKRSRPARSSATKMGASCARSGRPRSTSSWPAAGRDPRGRGRLRLPRSQSRTRPSAAGQGAVAARVFLEADELVCVLGAAAALDERARSGSSPRRDQIELLLAEGLSPTAIARRLGLSPQTVAYHAGRIRKGDPLRRRGAAIDRYAIMTTLGCAGLRAHELCVLNVEDVDLVHDRLNIRDAKTAAGVRYVYMYAQAQRGPGAVCRSARRLPRCAAVPQRDRSPAHARQPAPAGVRAGRRPRAAAARPSAAIRCCPGRSRRTRCGGRSSRFGWTPIRRPRSHG